MSVRLGGGGSRRERQLTSAEHLAAALANVCTGATSRCLIAQGLMSAAAGNLGADDTKDGGWLRCRDGG